MTMSTSYPTIANCNYESADDDTIHRARLAAEKLPGSPDALDTALQALETELLSELTTDGEYRHGRVSQEVIEEAEAEVISAYGDGPDHAAWVRGQWVAQDDDGARW